VNARLPICARTTRYFFRPDLYVGCTSCFCLDEQWECEGINPFPYCQLNVETQSQNYRLRATRQKRPISLASSFGIARIIGSSF